MQQIFCTSRFTDSFATRLGPWRDSRSYSSCQFWCFSSFNQQRSYVSVSNICQGTFSTGRYDSGDFNLFANRQFYRDTGGTQFGGLAIEVLEDVVREFSRLIREQITYNISCSSPTRSTFEYVAHGETNLELGCIYVAHFSFLQQAKIYRTTASSFSAWSKFSSRLLPQRPR